MSTPLGDFGAPPDAMAWSALSLAALLLVANHPALARRTARIPERALVAALAVFAAVVSFAYVAVYLRGGPRIIDATTYWLQARALSEGHVAFDVPSPTASFRGRFLLATADGHALAGIFPPGYPALLALGFLSGVPLLVGPVLAALLVVATYLVAMRLFADAKLALLAAALSATSGVLRYHTADTMSHGLSALLFALAVLFAMNGTARALVVAGLFAGWLVATRPVTGVVALAVCASLVVRTPRALALLAAGALGPLVLFVVEQRVATGAWLTSSQAAYYASADVPSGCFRYGFGDGIGCTFEHGDFVRARLAHGYGALAAVGTTLRRLKMHLADAANVELFAPLVVYGLVLARTERRARVPALSILGVMLAYAPFYFDGNYPGGGARFYADVLPFEHVLLALALTRLQLAHLALPVALTGFSLHTVYDHLRLADREGGRPMFEPDVVKRAGVTHGLLFVDTDHGFDLGFDPAARDAQDGLVVARRRHDAHDAALWRHLGEPPAYEYVLSLAPHAPAPELVPVTFAPRAGIDSVTRRFEAEAEWPALVVEGGGAIPSFPPCASGHRALSLVPAPGRTLRVRLEIPVVRAGKYRIEAGWVTPAAGPGSVMVTSTGMSWKVASEVSAGRCGATAGPPFELNQPAVLIDISASAPATLDYLELVPSDPTSPTGGGAP
ncbi:MAG TPA: hypothetical protein VH062_02720 [Polyangiaceae bacterium]|nr:hypothetical protein [Polyangiaceae bacterium]